MVISFSFIFVVCNDTKKQNVPTTVVLSTRHQSAEARAQYGVNAMCPGGSQTTFETFVCKMSHKV